MEYLSHHLRVLRAAQGKTQEYVGSLIKKNQGAYSRIERGKDKLSVDDLNVIAKDFGLTPHELLEMAQKPPFPQKNSTPGL